MTATLLAVLTYTYVDALPTVRYSRLSASIRVSQTLDDAFDDLSDVDDVALPSSVFLGVATNAAGGRGGAAAAGAASAARVGGGGGGGGGGGATGAGKAGTGSGGSGIGAVNVQHTSSYNKRSNTFDDDALDIL